MIAALGRRRIEVILLAAAGVATVVVLALALLGFYLLRYGTVPVRYEGTSMLPSLADGDRIFLTREIEPLRRGDIVAFYYPEDRSLSFIKRIVGLPGETVEFRDGRVLIDGRVLEEPYVDPRYAQRAQRNDVFTVPEDAYFVLGDNRDHSNDSRQWGAVPRALIWGKYWMHYPGEE